MSMYAIKDTTLTALGDAIRGKTSKYIGVEEIPAPLFDININTREMEYTIQNGQRDFYIPVNFKEILGDDAYNSMTNLYISCNYQCYVGGAFTYWPGKCRIYFGVSGFDILKSQSPLENELNLTFKLTAHELSQPDTYIHLNANDWCFTDKPYDAWFKGNIKIWAMDSNSSYLVYNSFTPLEMVEKIDGLDIIPNEALTITGDCQYKFSGRGWNWFIEQVGEKITTIDISNANNMFDENHTLKRVPFEINLKSNTVITNMFDNCWVMREFPQVNITTTTHISLQYIFANCYCMREIPEWFIDLLEEQYNLTATNNQFGKWSSMLNSCYSLRQIPERAMRAIRNPNPSSNYYGVIYCKPFTSCFCLDELLNVACDNCAYTSNQFSNFFANLYRCKDITLETNEDGTPLVRQWKSQTIDLSATLGYIAGPTYIISYNSGITADKEVKDDATYQALKNDPDWFATKPEYSRYNHNSAVNTINSLPDCSAYGTNTIKFKGQLGALTDGGAINTLTEEEIAVATAKGWTVSLV